MLPAMVAVSQMRRMSYADYLALEREADVRHEYINGEAFAMAGGTPRHAKLKTNLTGLMFAALGSGPCQAYDADLKVRIVATGMATYPDLTIVCGPLERHPEDPNAIANPTVVFEVLSDSTEAWDRGAKFSHFQRVPSLRHYVLVSQGGARVERFTRIDAATWQYTAFGPGEVVELAAIGASIEVDALYRNLPD